MRHVHDTNLHGLLLFTMIRNFVNMDIISGVVTHFKLGMPPSLHQGATK